MLIKDSNGKYVFQVDKQRRIVYEENIGSWEKEDYLRYWDEYKNRIMLYLGKGNWAKSVDMRKGMPNTKVTPELVNEHVKWIMENGCNTCAVLVDSATLKMQINRSTRSMALEICYFDNEKEADEWLKAKGY